MSESYDKLKKQKDRIVARQQSKDAQELIARGFDAFRICVGIKPKQYSSRQVIDWINFMGTKD